MDKIVKHRFWILLALVPPLVVFGYYKANGAITAATTARVADLDAKLNAIPPGNGPNPTWVKEADGGIEIYNKLIEKAVTAEKVRVWTDQLPRMTWPVKMEPFVPRTPAGLLDYRAEMPREAGFTYKAGYTDQLEKLYQSIEPLKQEKGGGVSGKVHLNRSAIPRHTFGDMLISSESIWDAQEDLWLLQLLFDSIRGVNRPAENAAKSAVRRLSYIRLMGGDGNSTVRGAAGGRGGALDGRLEGGDEAFGGLIGPAARGGMAGGMGGGMGQVNVSFEPAEEFGVGFEGMAGGGRGGVDAGDEDVMNMPMARGGMGAAGGGLGPTQKEIRYIKFEAGSAFRERGFYMSVLIDQRKIADFMVELSNADWPIRIVRFNVGPNGGASGAPQASPFMAGGRMEDSDDLSSMLGMGGGGPNFGGALRGGGGGGFGGPADMGFGGDDLFTAPLMGGGDGDELDPLGMGLGRAGGMIGAAPMVRGDQIGGLFTHPDLVQLDLCGVITMYNPPAPELLAAAGLVPGAADAPDAVGPGVEADSVADPAGDAVTADPALEAFGSPDGAADLEAFPSTDPATDAAAPEETSDPPPDDAASDPSPVATPAGT